MKFTGRGLPAPRHVSEAHWRTYLRMRKPRVSGDRAYGIE